MNREDIIRMAREAGFEQLGPDIEDWVCFTDEIERFAALVAAAAKAEENEACAKVCDDFERAKWESVKDIAQNGGRLAFAGPMHCAAAIRARGQA